MNAQQCEQVLRDEGFVHIFEWHDEPGTVYPIHQHQDKVTIFVTKGSVQFDIDYKEVIVKEGERFDVPPKTDHRALIGDNGCDYVVGEMIKGDS